MKTKFLFSAAVLSAMFAACTNEDFVDNSKVNVANDGRPVAGKVVLDFGGAATRMGYDSETDKFTWDGTETIAALLMDEVYGTVSSYRPYNDPDEWAGLTWAQKYKLVDYINTNYPFTWSTEEKAWVSNAKMLEGNYFFAYPRETYNGERQLIHSLANQIQEGSTKTDMEKAFARNQYWIGYSQIKAGVKNEDVLATVKMARTLSPIKFKIKAVTTKNEYTVEKITVQGKDLKTLLTINPTEAGYNGKADPLDNTTNGKYNLKENSVSANSTEFNYANFIGSTEKDFTAPIFSELYDNEESATDVANIVYNIEEGNESNYSWGDAIRAAVHAGKQAGADKEYAELYIKNAKPISGQNQNEVWGVVFVNLDETVDDQQLEMSIYTDKGIVKNIDLTVVNTGDAGGYKVITDHAIKTLAPTGNEKEITIQIDDNSFDIPQTMTMNNVDDLERFIQWNQITNRINTATLANNDTLTVDMAEMLINAQGVQNTQGNRLKVVASGSQKLFIESGVDADIFKYIDVEGVDVVVLGNLNLNDEELKANTALPTTPKTIIVAEGAELTIAAASAKQLDIVNQGQIKVTGSASKIKLTNKKNANVEVSGTLEFAASSTNDAEGTMTVEESGILKGTSAGNFENSGYLENNGEIYNIANNADGVVKTSSKVNNFQSNNADGIILKSKIDDPISGLTNLSTGTAAGIIKFVSGTTVDMSKVKENYITNLEINGAALHVEDEDASVLKVLEITDGTIEGGSYTSGVWGPAHKLLNMANDATAEMSGSMTLSYVTIKAENGVKILKGETVMKNDVQIADATNATTKYALVLGSVEGYKKNGVTIRNSGTVLVGTLNTEAGTESVIYNNGEFGYTSNGSDVSGIQVNGAALIGN